MKSQIIRIKSFGQFLNEDNNEINKIGLLNKIKNSISEIKKRRKY